MCGCGPVLAACFELPVFPGMPPTQDLWWGLANVQHGAQVCPTEACPSPREGLSAHSFTWKNPAAHRPERKRLQTRV